MACFVHYHDNYPHWACFPCKNSPSPSLLHPKQFLYVTCNTICRTRCIKMLHWFGFVFRLNFNETKRLVKTKILFCSKFNNSSKKPSHHKVTRSFLISNENDDWDKLWCYWIIKIYSNALFFYSTKTSYVLSVFSNFKGTIALGNFLKYCDVSLVSSERWMLTLSFVLFGILRSLLQQHMYILFKEYQHTTRDAFTLHTRWNGIMQKTRSRHPVHTLELRLNEQ